VAAPFVVLLFPFLIFWFLMAGRIDLYELRIQKEFAWLVECTERIRCSNSERSSLTVLLIRSAFRHSGLAHLYRSQVRWIVLWATGPSVFFAQILLLYPSEFVNRIVLSGENYFSLDMAVKPLSPSRRLLRLRERTLAELGCSQSRYVTMAVFTSTKEEQADPEYASRTLPRETIGADLAESVDFLRANGVDVIMLGFPDSGKAHVPREMPRLSDFAQVGGLHEVALASGCLYFWAESVGAFWLREPFKRWGLITNGDERLTRVDMNYPKQVLDKWIYTLIRYRTPSGNFLTMRESMSHGSCFESVARGELIAIRNSPVDLVEAHREMLLRANGSFVVNDRLKTLQEQLSGVYADFPQYAKLPIAGSFLNRYPYLLD